MADAAATRVPVAAPDAGAGVGDGPIPIEEVTIEQGSWPAEGVPPPPDRDALGERIVGEIVLSNLFVERIEAPQLRGPKRARDGHRRGHLVAEYALATKGKEARAAISLTMRWRGAVEDPAFVEMVACEGKPAEAHALLECAVSAAVKGIILKERVSRGELPPVLNALGSEDPALRSIALEAVKVHQIRAAVPRLLVMLESPDVMVREGAIGALVVLREERAVAPLTRLASFRDVEMLRSTIDAVGRIGGDEARAWLELVASGHDDPAIRRMASQELLELPAPPE